MDGWTLTGNEWRVRYTDDCHHEATLYYNDEASAVYMANVLAALLERPMDVISPINEPEDNGP